jgi:RNA polymerase sigma factor (sigma-70 family)
LRPLPGRPRAPKPASGPPRISPGAIRYPPPICPYFSLLRGRELDLAAHSESPIDEDALRRLLDRLASAEQGEAWAEFLDAYARRILQVVHRVEWDADRRTDCFVFVCEELRRNRCRRLLRFDPTKGASFLTWVRVVTHNLCLDWHRQQVGRFRLFRSLADLSPLDEEIYRRVFAGGLSAREARHSLQPDYPDLTESRVAETIEHIRQELTPRQHWLLSMQRPKVVPLAGGEHRDEDAPERQIADTGPDPELLAAREERRDQLVTALGRLSGEDRLLLGLRYEQGLTLRQVAELMELNNAQQADRRLREVLALLREELD